MDATLPLVTVICTCYNHADYVEEAIASVFAQSYPHIQLIVVDNFSSDRSVEIIQHALFSFPGTLFIQNKENKGICRAFNEAVAFAKGKYLIDLAADDVLLPDRIEKQVQAFEQLPASYALLYSNIAYIDPQGTLLHAHFKPSETPPEGDVFASLLEKHFLPSPSTIFKTDVFLSLGGYNIQLAFEDFDYWIRCARQHAFAYLPILSTKKRILPHSLSMEFYSTRSDRMLESTWVTFHWAYAHLNNRQEEIAFVKGASYYFRQSVLLGHFQTAKKFHALFPSRKTKFSSTTLFCLVLFYLRLDLSWFYAKYLTLSTK